MSIFEIRPLMTAPDVACPHEATQFVYALGLFEELRASQMLDACVGAATDHCCGKKQATCHYYDSILHLFAANDQHDRRFRPGREAPRFETYESMLLLSLVI